MKTPVRMLEDQALAPELRHDLAQVYSAPEPYDVEAGERRLAVALGVAVTAAAGAELLRASAETVAGAHVAAGAGGGVLGSTALKLVLGVAVAGAVGAGVVAWPARPKPEPRAHASAPAKVAAPSPAVSPQASTPAPPAEPAPSSLPLEAVARPDAPRAVDHAAGEPRPAQAGATARMDLAQRREIAQLARIKALMPTDPLRAFRLAEAGHREFPAGMLREEREALAVLALLRVHGDAEAVERGRAFLARYERSAHREEIVRALRRVQERDARGP